MENSNSKTLFLDFLSDEEILSFFRSFADSSSEIAIEKSGSGRGDYKISTGDEILFLTDFKTTYYSASSGHPVSLNKQLYEFMCGTKYGETYAKMMYEREVDAAAEKYRSGINIHNQKMGK